VGGVTRSYAFASDVIEGGGFARRARLRSAAILFGERAPRTESRRVLAGCRPHVKLGIATGMPTFRRRK
jgi:hypothetical protein